MGKQTVRQQTMIDVEGNSFVTEVFTSLCRCGQSGDNLFCEGIREAIDFNSSPQVRPC